MSNVFCLARKNYIFLLSRNKYEDSNIRSGKDLLSQFQRGDDDVFAIHITSLLNDFSIRTARAFGFQQAFFDGCYCVPNSPTKIASLVIPLVRNDWGVLQYSGWYPKLETLYKLEV